MIIKTCLIKLYNIKDNKTENKENSNKTYKLNENLIISSSGSISSSLFITIFPFEYFLL